MRRSLSTRRTVYNLLTNKSFQYVHSNFKYCLSMQTNEVPKRGLKVEKEYQTLWRRILPDIIETRKVETVEEWKALKDELFKATPHLTPVNIDAYMLKYYIGRKQYDRAYNCMRFLKEGNVKPNLATVGQYFRLFYLTNQEGVAKAAESDILALYKEVRETYKFLDSITGESVIVALSLTENWRECLKLLEEIKISSDPSKEAFSVTAAAAFRNGEEASAWKLLGEIADKGRSPASVAFLSYLEQCDKTTSADICQQNIEKLFEFFRCYDIKCEDQVADKISSIYKKFQLNCKSTTVSKRAVCQNCNLKLKKTQLTPQDFDKLKDTIFKNVIVGKNVFCRTTPEELKKFKNFIARMKKYDVVIDGLNVGYSAGIKQSPHVFSTLVVSVVNHFLNLNKRILVLGRTHMEKWSARNWSYVTKHADTFLAETLSHDDPYLLYCALNSGLGTIIVTKDLMRSHVFKLQDPQLKVLFKQWLMQSQYQLLHVNNQGKAHFKYPLPYNKVAQKQNSCWHIPCSENEDVGEDRWLCLCK